MKIHRAILLTALCIPLLGVACSRTITKQHLSALDSYMQKAESFYDDGDIDSSLYYIDLCYGLEKDYPPARYLEGKIFLDKGGIYNRRISATSLKKAVLQESDNSEYHFALGKTFEEQGYLQNALHEYGRSAELDSTDSRPLERIAEINRKIGLRYDDKKYFRRSLKAAEAAARLTADPEDFYRQGISYYQMGEYSSSIGVLNKGIELCNEPSEMDKLLLLLGTDYVQMSEYDSANFAFEKARAGMTELERSEMDNLKYVLSPAEYAKYESESNYNQNRMINEIWGRMDPDPTTDINERKLQHYARFVHARITFSIPDKSIDGTRTKRGEIYIRYGRPTSMDYVLGSAGDASDPPKWVWSYTQFATPITLIFEDTFLNGDFDFPYPKKGWTSADYANDPSRLAAMLQSTVPQTFDYASGTGPLEYFYMPRQFKGRRGKTDIELFLTIPYTQLTYHRDGEYALAEVNWRQVLRYGSWKLADSSSVLRTYRIRASQVDNPNLSVADRLALSSYPDSLLFSIAVQDTLSGHMGIDTAPMGIRDFYSDRVEISDIVLARRIDTPPGGGEIERDNLRILSNLDNRYFIREPILLYFEIYNLKKGDDGRTSYALTQTVREKEPKGILAEIKGIVKSDKRKEVSISYTGANIYSDENRILTIDASELEPGDYTIIIEVNDKISGKTAISSEDVVLYR